MGPPCAIVNFGGSLFLSFLVIHQRVMSDLTCKPVDSESRVNESTYFNCSSSITAKEIHWYHYPVGVEAHERKTVYAFGKFYKDYEEDFVLEKNSSNGAYNLVIQSVNPGYAGQYECQEDRGYGNSTYAQLIVLDDGPECNSDIDPDGVIGRNTCDIQPDKLHLSCSISYYGNIPPELKWIKLGENDSIRENVTKDWSANRVTYNLTVKADLLKDKSSFECQTTKFRTVKHSCTSETVKLLYIFSASSVSVKNIGEVVNCSANTSSQSCQYKWKWYDKEDTLTVSENRILKIEKEGQHRCEATCILRDKQCTVNAILINSTQSSSSTGSETTSVNGSSSTSPVVGVVLGVLCLLVVGVTAVFVVIFLRIRRRRNSKHNGVVAYKRSERTDYPVLLTHGFTVERPEVEEGEGTPGTVERPEVEEGEGTPGTVERPEVEEGEGTPGTVERPEVEEGEGTPGTVERPEVEEGEGTPGTANGQSLAQQAEQKKATSSKLPSEQSRDAKNMTENATNGEETNDKTKIDETNEESNVEKTNEKERIERHREFLKERMDPDFGLLDTLRANKTLSGEEIAEVKGKNSFYRRNSQLIDYILEKHQYDGLIAALRNNEQLHIVNYLNANGDTNQKSLVDLLDLSILLGLLYSAKIMNKRQMEFISSEPTLCRKNEALLDILRRRSLREFQKAIGCLNCSNQRRIAEVFESGGVVAEVHAHLDGPSEHVSMAEDEISTKIANELSGKSFEESQRIWELTHLKLIDAKKGRSIVLYIWCDIVEELQHLQELVKSGHLKDSAEQLFNPLLTCSKKVALKDITMNDEEIKCMKAYFTGEPEANKTEQATAPLMALDAERREHTKQHYTGQNKGLQEECDDIETDGTSAPLLAFNAEHKEEMGQSRAEPKKGSEGCMRQFSDNSPLHESKVAILDNNLTYLIENIDTEIGLLTSMFEKNVITLWQMQSISAHGEPCKRSEALLGFIRRGSQWQYERTIDALKESNQECIANVLIHGHSKRSFSLGSFL